MYDVHKHGGVMIRYKMNYPVVTKDYTPDGRKMDLGPNPCLKNNSSNPFSLFFGYYNKTLKHSSFLYGPLHSSRWRRKATQEVESALAPHRNSSSGWFETPLSHNQTFSPPISSLSTGSSFPSTS